MTRLTSVRTIPAYCVIIRAIHERGEFQLEAFAELKRRGLWLTEEQKEQAQLTWVDDRHLLDGAERS